jgi:flagellar motor switch protein FliN
MGDPTLNQDEIDALLKDVQDPTEGPMDSGAKAGADDFSADFAAEPPAAQPAAADFAGDDLATMMDEAPARGPAGAHTAAAEPAADVSEFANRNIQTLLDVPLQVVVELGRTEMPIQKILELGPGSVVELNRLAGEPINVLVNGKLVARGEVVVVDESFGVKVTSIITPLERLSQLN